MISKSLEEYVKTMYILKKQNNEIRVTDIAIKMGCSKASVTKSLNILKEQSLVMYSVYGPIELTEEGEKLARKVLEASDIVKTFLKEILEVDEENIEEETSKLKASISDATLILLARYVHKTLGLYSLECNYDINNDKCVNCLRTQAREKLVKEKRKQK